MTEPEALELAMNAMAIEIVNTAPEPRRKLLEAYQVVADIRTRIVDAINDDKPLAEILKERWK